MTDIEPGSVVLVTGASGAIGSEIAARAAAAGAIVGVHGSQKSSVDKAIRGLEERVPGAKLVPAPADFLQDGAIATLVSDFTDQQGRLDAVIHCAITGAAGVVGAFADTDPASYGLHTARVMGSLQQLCYYALPYLSRSGGAIITFASDAGRFSAPRQALIGGAFGGVISFTRNLAREVARDGVRVNCVSPGFVKDTPAFERFSAAGQRADTASRRAGLGLPGPEDIAPLVLFLCGRGAEKITGQVISVNGGLNA